MATARGALTVQVPAPSSDTKHGRINRKKNLGQPSRAPHGWPSDVLYYVGNDLSQLSGRDKSLVRPGSSFKIPGITIRKIDEVGHPARGQHGLYATRDFEVGEVLGEYTGVAVSGEKGGAYTTRLWDKDAPSCGYQLPGIDASIAGNEFRMINDFRGVPGASGANAVKKGCEFLLDYGDHYWSAEIQPKQPPGPVTVNEFPTPEELAPVEAELCAMLEQADHWRDAE